MLRWHPLEKLLVIGSTLRAIVFDFNGVIADDELLHFLSFQQVLSEHGLSLTKKEYYGTYLGMDERICAEALMKAQTGRVDQGQLDRIAGHKAAMFNVLTATQKPLLFPGVIEFVREAGTRCRLAIASGGRREQIEDALRGTPLERDFAVLVSAEDAPVGKPDPAIYVMALSKLNTAAPVPQPSVTPAQCLVIEDSVAGIQSAHRAGMKVVAIATTYPAAELKEADMIASSVRDIDWRKVELLFD
jgi:beta-phosphoglucomutase